MSIAVRSGNQFICNENAWNMPGDLSTALVSSHYHIGQWGGHMKLNKGVKWFGKVNIET